MQLTCPNCRRSIELVEPEAADVLTNTAGGSTTTCPVCGSALPMLAATITSAPQPQQRIGRFELRERLGQGQFGVVWKAWDTEIERIVALKIPRTVEILEKGEELFRKEARAIAALDHPNIVRLHEVQREAGLIVIVTEYIEGTTLQRQLSNSSYSFQQTAEICRQIADALQHAHERGIVHRDIKPNNVLINTEGIPKLADFGLAKRDHADITMTLDGQILGTPAYMPPEQAQGHSHAADARSDVYSLGVVLYEMLTGRLPFQGTSRALLDQVISCDPRAPRRLVKSIPRDLETICLTAMAKEPARRYQTAAAFASDLQRYLNGEVIVARPARHVEKILKWSRRHPWQIATGVLAVLSIMIGLAWGASPSHSAVPRIETRLITIDTDPTNARLVFYPRDPQTGEPIPKNAIRPRSRSKARLELPVGDYLVVAVLDDGRFHEVYRRVPGMSAGMATQYAHLGWESRGAHEIELWKIKIPDADITQNMVEFTGSSQFQMGIKGDTVVPAHDRVIPPFYLDPHEVTIAEFRAKRRCMPIAWPRKEIVPDKNVAVTRLLFDEAVVFAERSGKRLMTEGEYEFAATLGGTRAFPWGDEPPPVDWPIEPVTKVSRDKLPTQPELTGLFSNVGEWTSSWPLSYPGHLKMGFDSGNLPVHERVVRGAPPHIGVGIADPKRSRYGPRYRVCISMDTNSKDVGLRMARSRRPRLTADDFERVLPRIDSPSK